MSGLPDFLCVCVMAKDLCNGVLDWMSRPFALSLSF
jgi:hypothetical protein